MDKNEIRVKVNGGYLVAGRNANPDYDEIYIVFETNVIWWLLIGWYLYLLKYIFIGIWYFWKFILYTLPCKIIQTIKNIYTEHKNIKE